MSTHATEFRHTMLYLSIVVLCALTGCRQHTDRDPIAIANTTLGALHLPMARDGEVSLAADWWVSVERGVNGRRLLLVQQVAALVLPDGPLELTAPLTYFRFEEHAWRQYHDAQESIALSEMTAKALQQTMTDTTRVYFFKAEPLEIWSAALDSVQISAVVQQRVQALKKEVARLRSTGFLTMDAEP